VSRALLKFCHSTNEGKRWLKQSGLDTPDLGHLKRIRKQNAIISLLLTTSATPPVLPEDIELPNAYTLPVPISPALTALSLSLKSSLWPTVYAPPRKNEAENWTRGKCRWAWETMKHTVEAAAEANSRAEVYFYPKSFNCTAVLIFVGPVADRCAHPGTVRNGDSECCTHDIHGMRY
jgi:hypothetical protein